MKSLFNVSADPSKKSKVNALNALTIVEGCDLIKTNGEAFLNTIKEVNSKVSSMSIVRQNFLKALVEIAKYGSSIDCHKAAW